jgi:hypothetical protein
VQVDAAAANHPDATAAGLLEERSQQRRLADPSLTADEQAARLPGEGVVEGEPDLGELCGSPYEDLACHPAHG